MTPLDESYEEILLPHNFIKNFVDMEHFKVWARTGGINDLKEAIKVFEKHELYEHCRAMQDVIDDKVDRMLSGLGFEID